MNTNVKRIPKIRVKHMPDKVESLAHKNKKKQRIKIKKELKWKTK